VVLESKQMAEWVSGRGVLSMQSGVSCGECVGCSEAFCQLCSTLNYQLREERLFCLSCRPRAAPASLIPQPELVGIVENI
jgi:hypothetical protein